MFFYNPLSFFLESPHHLPCIFTVLNEVAKVMFLHLSVVLFTGGVFLSACWDTPQDQAPPWEQTPPPPQDQAPPGPGTPPPRRCEQRRLLLRTVRILLECILVTTLNLLTNSRANLLLVVR